jgi:hypothetical protein
VFHICVCGGSVGVVAELGTYRLRHGRRHHEYGHHHQAEARTLRQLLASYRNGHGNGHGHGHAQQCALLPLRECLFIIQGLLKGVSYLVSDMIDCFALLRSYSSRSATW